MYFPLFVGVLCLSLFWYALLCVLSYFAIILKSKRELVTSFNCLTDVLSLYIFVVFPHGAVVWSAVYDCGIS